MALVKLCFSTHTEDSCSITNLKGMFYVWLNPSNYSRSFSNDWTPMPIGRWSKLLSRVLSVG